MINQHIQTRQNGIGIIELMISLVLGLVIVAGVITIFLSNARANNYQQSQITLQENSRHMHLLFGNVIRQTGYLPMNTKEGELIAQKNLVFPAETTDIKFANAGQVISGIESTVSGVAKDQFSIRFKVDSMTVNCFGDTVPVSSMPLDSLERNTYRINADELLECQRLNDAGGTDTQPIIGSNAGSVRQQLSVQSMSVHYGLDTDNNKSIDTIARASSVGDWSQVRCIELVLTIKAGKEIKPQQVRYYFDLPNMDS
ncbi:MAG: PilW family protein [Gammaproteobacteria bacterium]|nr:PilW family protein [Gammaproteobacteria bacterium]